VQQLSSSAAFLRNQQGFTVGYGLSSGRLNHDELQLLERLIPGALSKGGSKKMVTKALCEKWDAEVDAGLQNIRRMNEVLLAGFLEKRKVGANIKATMLAHRPSAGSLRLQLRAQEGYDPPQTMSDLGALTTKAPSGGQSKVVYRGDLVGRMQGTPVNFSREEDRKQSRKRRCMTCGLFMSETPSFHKSSRGAGEIFHYIV
jgi:hypothetical protein